MKYIFQKFAHREDGAFTILGLFVFIAMIVIGGLALDVSSAMMARTQLQVAADAVAHAALYSRDWDTAAEAKTKALALAEINMPSSKFGAVLTVDDIQFGYWHSDTQTFELDANSKNGVRVDTSRLQENS